MPEGPELHLAARFINRRCHNMLFAGSVEKSEVSKNPEIPFRPSKDGYTLQATARGKEMKVFMQDAVEKGVRWHILFRFGMSGCFMMTRAEELPKHAHLRFKSKDGRHVLSFVDYRRFGKWQPEGDWGDDRGPDPIFEYQAFRDNVLNNLHNVAFNRPICEAMLNQQFFNGIGNYLRAEILFRAKIPPFNQAREVLNSLKKEAEEPSAAKVKLELKEEDAPDASSSRSVNTRESTVKVERYNSDCANRLDRNLPDLLELCHIVPSEVLALGDNAGYNVDRSRSIENEFENWLRCYYQDGMRNLVDSSGRTMWFSGDAGKMAPKNAKSRKSSGYKGKSKKNSTGNTDSKVKEEEQAEVTSAQVDVSSPAKRPRGARNKVVVGKSPNGMTLRARKKI